MTYRTAIVAAYTAVMLGAAMGCTDTGTQDASSRESKAVDPEPTVTNGSGDPRRYCQLVEELDARGNKVFGELGRDATPAQYRRAERRFIEESAGLLAQLEPAVPARLRDDVRTFMSAMRQRAGLAVPEAVSDKAASEAERRLRDFERHACQG
jgi:hypothetical protein